MSKKKMRDGKFAADSIAEKRRAQLKDDGSSPGLRTMKDRIIHFSPARLVIFITSAIFLCESAVMILLSYLRSFSTWGSALLNSLLLVVLLSPILFFFLFRPLILHMRQREQAETFLRESEEKYRTLFEQSKDAIYITTREGEFIDVNQSALDLLGYTRAEIMKLGVLSVYANPDDRPRFQKAIEKRGSVKDYEVRLRKKDGTEIECLLTSTVHRAEGRAIDSYHGIVRDVTDQRRAEQELRQRMAELEEFQKVTIGRELKMVELKERIRDLEEEISNRPMGGDIAQDASAPGTNPAH